MIIHGVHRGEKASWRRVELLKRAYAPHIQDLTYARVFRALGFRAR